MIPVIMKGETSKPIQLALKEGYEYSGCALHVNFCGLRDTFVDLAAGGSVELRYTAEQTARLPLGTSKVMLSIENARNEICFMPWAKIKVTDCPEDVRDAQITIDPATLNVEDLTTKDTLASVKSRLNAVMAFLRGLSSLAVLALPLYALSDVAPLTAPLDDIPGDTPLMTNVVSYVDAKVAAIPGPDYSTGNTQLVATIKAKAPAPGDYATVSNRAMSALQSHQSLWPAVEASTNYTDAALGAFASTGAVARATVYGTPTRWTDATGCVWEVMLNVWVDHAEGNVFRGGTSIFPSGEGGDMRGYLYYDPAAMEYVGGAGGGWYYNGSNSAGTPGSVFAGGPDATSLDNGRFTFGNFTNLVGRVALTNDIPDVSGYATPADVTAAIREHSLLGIWDDKLGVWWTPHMSGGAYYWTATTNVNLAVEGNQ